MYDLIGDIHGYATPLKMLLNKLGYVERDGIWRHPGRKVIFLGDFIDRGPEQVETVRIARTMVEAGQALAVMGNHEFNAVGWDTPHPDNPGQTLRPRSEKNRRQHREFLDQVGENSRRHREIIDWFKTLPLYLDLDGLRVVHACWHPGHLDNLAGCLDAGGRVLPKAWPELHRKGTKSNEAVENIPADSEFADADGHFRRNVRIQWWDAEGITYRDLAIVPPEVIESIPHEPIVEDIVPEYAGDKPLFVGHYWLSGTPAPLTPHIACLDYSIAATRGQSYQSHGILCAYRWQGESILDPDNFLWVPGSAASRH